MSKTEYTLLAAVIGFYALLFAYLLMRACASIIRARWPTSTKIKKGTLRVSRNRGWTRAVWRAPLTPDVNSSKPAGVMTA